MKTYKWSELKAKRFTKEEIAASAKRVEGEILEMNLVAIREQLGKTQAEIAKVAEMSQGDVSKAERRDDHLVSTLRRMIEALGGVLEVYANVDGRKIKLVGV